MILAISSCGLCQQDLNLPDTKEPEVEVLKEQDNSEKGVLLYKPTLPSKVDDLIDEPQEETAEICDFEVERYTSETIEIRRKVVQGVYINIQEEFTEDVVQWARTKARQSKYVFINDNLLYVASGSSLSFIDWAIIDVDGQDVLWGEDFVGDNKRMDFDGTFNIREYLYQEEITFNLDGRGKSPGQRTNVGFYIDFLFLSNCEET